MLGEGGEARKPPLVCVDREVGCRRGETDVAV